MNLDNMFKKISDKGLTLKKVSQATGLSSGILSEWKNGNRIPSITKLEKVADFLECSVDYLIGRNEEDGMVQSVNLENLLKRAKSYGLKMKDISEETGISTSVLSDWKNGKSTPTVSKLLLVAEYLECSLDYIIGKTEVSETPTMMLKVYFDDNTYSKSFFESEEELKDSVLAWYTLINNGEKLATKEKTPIGFLFFKNGNMDGGYGLNAENMKGVWCDGST